jgi:hypothetical protein
MPETIDDIMADPNNAQFLEFLKDYTWVMPPTDNCFPYIPYLIKKGTEAEWASQWKRSDGGSIV